MPSDGTDCFSPAHTIDSKMEGSRIDRYAVMKLPVSVLEVGM